mgnify:CR=1 FL=1
MTDYYKKGTIEDIVELRKNGLIPMECRAYFKDMLKALFYCHKTVEVFHRDIKPANIVIDHDNSAVLIDFGLSSIRDSDFLKHAEGSLQYYAPEMFTHAMDKDQVLLGEKVDIWALGITLFYMTLGKTPFESAGKKGTIQAKMKLRDLIVDGNIDFDEIVDYELRELL